MPVVNAEFSDEPRKENGDWVGLGCALVVAGIFVARYLKGRRISVTGAGVRKDTDSNKELPIADVERPEQRRDHGND